MYLHLYKLYKFKFKFTDLIINRLFMIILPEKEMTKNISVLIMDVRMLNLRHYKHI